MSPSPRVGDGSGGGILSCSVSALLSLGFYMKKTKWTRPSKRINQDPNGSTSELGSSSDSPMKVPTDTKSSGKDSISSEPNREEEQGELLTHYTVVLNNDIPIRTWK